MVAGVPAVAVIPAVVSSSSVTGFPAAGGAP